MIKTNQTCTSCGIEKHIEYYEFRKDTNKYRRQCKTCRNKVIKKNKESRQEFYYDYHAKYREDNRAELREWQIKHYNNNKDKILKKRNDKRKTVEGRLIRRNERLKRRSIEKSGNVDNSYIKEIANNRSKCYWCNVDIKNKKFHIDHYIPISNGGTHTKDNIVITCPTCNMSKNKKDPFLYAQEQGRLL